MGTLNECLVIMAVFGILLLLIAAVFQIYESKTLHKAIRAMACTSMALIGIPAIIGIVELVISHL